MNSTLSDIVARFPPGINPTIAITLIWSTINVQFVPPKSKSIMIELWALFAGSALIILLSAIGLFMRWYKKTFWLFSRTSDGTLRPNAAITTQLCFMLYSIFHLSVLTTSFLTNKVPSNLAFVWGMISFTPLGFAFIFITWSTILAPTTSLSFLNIRNNATLVKKSGRTVSYIAILTAILYQLSLIYPAVYTARARSSWASTGLNFMTSVALVLKEGTGIPGLLLLEPSFDSFKVASIELMRWYRVSVTVYCSWTLVWVLVYVTAATRLIFTLFKRRHQLHRSVNSLRVLDELVTHDDIELSKISSSDQSFSPPPSPKSPRKPRLSHQLSQLPLINSDRRIGSRSTETLNISSPSSPTRSPFSSHRSDYPLPIIPSPSYQQPSTIPLRGGSGYGKGVGLMEKRKNVQVPPALKFPTLPVGIIAEQTSSRSQERLAELSDTLSRTNRLLMTILIQFIIACVMTISYSAFGMVVLANKISKSDLLFIYASWLGWTFVLPALIGTIVFTTMSFMGPRTNFLPPSPLPNATQIHHPSCEEFDFTPELLKNQNQVEVPRKLKRQRKKEIESKISAGTNTNTNSFSPTSTTVDYLNPPIPTRYKGDRLTKSSSFFSLSSFFSPPATTSNSIDSTSVKLDYEEGKLQVGKNSLTLARGNGSQKWKPSDWAREIVLNESREEDM